MTYLVTGSTATIAYGEPRFTNDIKKMVYFQEGGSEKHLRDIAGVLRIQGESLDRAYIATWASALGLVATWTQVTKSERQV